MSSYSRLVDSHKGTMQLEDGSTLLVSETDEETEALVQTRWTLTKTHETQMSTVFLATNEQQGQRIVKTITSAKLSKNELGALVSLNTSGKKARFVHLYQWFEHFCQVYCMMEYVKLGDLGVCWKNHEPSEPEVQRITRQILQTLAAMHALGYTHRDIKPGNILIVSRDPPSIKICDFGISKQHNDVLHYTHTGSKTPAYAAPEVLGLDTSKMDQHVTNKVDIWALGCVIAELVTGRVLFGEISTIGLFCRSVQERERALSSVADRLSASGVELVTELLQPDPAQRPSAHEALSRPRLRNVIPVMVSTMQDTSNIEESLKLHPSDAVNTVLPAQHKEVEGTVGGTQMHAAASNRDITMVNYLKDLGQDIGIRDNDGSTPLHSAARNGQIDMVNHLKKLGQDIGVKHNNGSTPMHYAAYNGQISMVDHLKKLGQYIGVKNNNGYTPMHYAAYNGQIDMVDHLKELGQDIGVKSNDGYTPMQLAARNNQTAMIEHLN